MWKFAIYKVAFGFKTVNFDTNEPATSGYINEKIGLLEDKINSKNKDILSKAIDKLIIFFKTFI